MPITLAGSIGYMVAGWSQQALLPPLSIGFVSLVGVAIMAPISSYVAPRGVLTKPGFDNHDGDHSGLYCGFPMLVSA